MAVVATGEATTDLLLNVMDYFVSELCDAFLFSHSVARSFMFSVLCSQLVI